MLGKDRRPKKTGSVEIARKTAAHLFVWLRINLIRKQRESFRIGFEAIYRL
jgi:hypothetical protein